MSVAWEDEWVGRAPWAEGYPVETPYVDQVIPELCPARLSAIAVLHGHPPLPTDRRITWLDLGAGTGLPACVVAAANPTVDVWAYDYNPSHVERARSLAERAALANLRCEEASFEQLATDRSLGPPQVDVVVVHGVLSWVSPANQRHIYEIVRERLRPGGLAFLMYEVPTGWAALQPWIEGLRLHAAASGRPGPLAFPDAAAAVTALLEAGPSDEPLPPRERHTAAGWATANPLYAAHEYLGSHFGPLMFDEVAEPMAEAHCAFLGGVDVTDHLPQYWVPEELSDAVVGTEDVVLREMLRDLATRRPLRRDVYRRGLAAPPVGQLEAWLRELRFEGLGVPFGDNPAPVPGGQATLDPELHAPITEAIATRALDADGVLEIHPGWDWQNACSALALQVAAGYAAPAVPGGITPEARDGARRLNEVLVAENRMGADHAYLVAPATGSVVMCDSIELLTVGGLWDGHPAEAGGLADHVQAVLDRLGYFPREEGALVRDPAQARAIIERRVTAGLEKAQGPFVRLGIC